MDKLARLGDEIDRDALMQAFERQYVVVDSACWIWVGPRSSRGYGRMNVGKYGKNRGGVGAHCVSYWLFVSPVPEGKELDHLCRQPSCVNWRHLEPVTHRENVLRGSGPFAEKARRTHCLKCNQPLVPHGKSRGCPPCEQARNRKWWADNKDAINAARQQRKRSRKS